MKKHIPGTDGLYIDSNRNIGGTGEYQVIDEDTVRLRFFGKYRNMTRFFLQAVADYKYTDQNIIRRLVVTPQKSILGRMKPFPFFRTPIYYKNTNYRISPLFPRVAVSIDGDCICVKTGKPFAVRTYKNKNSDKGPYSFITGTYPLHRIVASAWVPNHDKLNYSLVNHLDNDGTNNHASNLEWTDYAGNNKHRVLWGKTRAAKPITIRNIYTDEVHRFASIKDTKDYLKLSDNNIESYINAELSHRLIHDEWEISTQENPVWFYPKDPILIGRFARPKAIVKIKIAGQDTVFCCGLWPIILHYRLFNLVPAHLENILKTLKERYPVEHIEIFKTPKLKRSIRKNLDRRIRITVKKTGRVYLLPSLREGARLFGMGRDVITRMLRDPREDDHMVVVSY